jgi:hypothetical protein
VVVNWLRKSAAVGLLIAAVYTLRPLLGGLVAGGAGPGSGWTIYPGPSQSIWPVAIIACLLAVLATLVWTSRELRGGRLAFVVGVLLIAPAAFLAGDLLAAFEIGMSISHAALVVLAAGATGLALLLYGLTPSPRRLRPTGN